MRIKFRAASAFVCSAVICLMISFSSAPARVSAQSDTTDDEYQVTIATLQIQIADLQDQGQSAATSTPHSDQPREARSGMTGTLEVTVTDVGTAAQVRDQFSSAETARGVFLTVYLTVVNEGNRPVHFWTDDLWVIDDEERHFQASFEATYWLWWSTFGESPELEPIPPGVTYKMVAVFDVPKDATGFTLTTVDGELSIALDQAAETSNATGEDDDGNVGDVDADDANAGAIEPTEENCAWAEDTLDRLSALQPVGTELQGMDDEEELDIERLREIADRLAEEAEAQRNSDPPTEAEEASEQIADALDVYANALHDVADAVEEDEVVDTTALLADVQDANELIEEAGTVTAPLLEACAA